MTEMMWRHYFHKHDSLRLLALASVSLGIGLVVNALRPQPLPLSYESPEQRLHRIVAQMGAGESAQVLAAPEISLPTPAPLSRWLCRMEECRSTTGERAMNLLRSSWLKRYTYLTTCWLLGGLFIYAGTIKVSDPQSFNDNIAAYQLLPAMLINPVALGLPIFEILTGVLLITG